MTSLQTTRERQDLLETLDQHRDFLRFTARNLTDAQAAQRTTVSALTIGGLIKHVAATEHAWIQFAIGGAAAWPPGRPITRTSSSCCRARRSRDSCSGMPT